MIKGTRTPLIIAVTMLLALLLGACGAAPTAPAAPEAAAPTKSGNIVESGGDTGHSGGDHGPMTASDTPFDAQFIDSMIVHHEGAIAMAKQAQAEAKRPELQAMAQAIITAQQTEIDQMKQWRKAWYPDLPETSGLDMQMGPMEVTGDATTPFEQRFIDAMIPHHEGAIDMAKEALDRAEHPEIKALAQAIITAQESEIKLMEEWRTAWAAQ